MATRKNTLQKIVIGVSALAVSTIGLGAFAATANAAMRGGQPGPVVTPGGSYDPPPPPAPPQYKVEAVRFKAINAGNDAFGSDEPYFIFSSVGNAVAATHKTHTFSGVDSGETRTFTSTEHCIYPLNCNTAGALAPNGIGININGWESDNTANAKTVLGVTAEFWQRYAQQNNMVPSVSWMQNAAAAAASLLSSVDDDFLDWYTINLTPEDLAALVPNVGSTSTLTKPIGLGYSIDVKVTRTA